MIKNNFLKRFIVSSGIFFSSLPAFAESLDFSGLVGTYSLIETQRGICPPTLRVTQGDFSNQLAEHSLTFSGVSSEGEPVMLYDLIALNAGPDFKFIPNPMLGGYVGTLYRKEELKSGRITALRRTRNMLGIIDTQQKLDARFSDLKLEYRYSTYNSLIRPILNRTDVCRYSKTTHSH